MIIVKLSGGLGNQMFQVALGTALSKHFSTDIKLDISFLTNNNISTDTFTARDLAVNVFRNSFEIAEQKDISLFFFDSKSLLKNCIKKLWSILYNPVIIKDTWNPEKLFERASKFTYLDGYWQSEDYFKDYKSDISKLFSFPAIPSMFFKYYERLKSCNSVSVHFRRGDYIHKQTISKIHNVCNMDYYNKAIEYIKEKQKDVKLFLFSDEPEWLVENFGITTDYEIINTKSDITDLHLMSLCKHNIIANSSFSWWGAWLNQNPEKIVVSPNRWFAFEIVNYENVVPETWIRL